MKALLSIFWVWLVLAALPLAFAEIDRSYYKTDEETESSWGKIPDRGSAAQFESIERIKQAVNGNHDLLESERIEYFGSALRKLAMPNIYQMRERFEVYDLVQLTLLRIPGHAEYYRDLIERERASLAPEAFRLSYDRKRRVIFETLSHLPSPETIRILGDYLDDERDALERAEWTSDGVLLQSKPNSIMAVDALKNIGLRSLGFEEPDPGEWPRSEDYATRDEERRAVFNYLVAKDKMRLKPWRAWFDEVKSGNRRFSFRGQAVEYRFKPDGSWDTLPIRNPPEDGPGRVGALIEERVARRPPPVKAGEDPVTSGSGPAWIAGVLIVVLVGLFWYGNRRMKS